MLADITGITSPELQMIGADKKKTAGILCAGMHKENLK